MQQQFGKPAALIPPLIGGGFNIHHRIQFKDEDSSSNVIVRLRWPAASCFAEEKVIYEATTQHHDLIGTEGDCRNK